MNALRGEPALGVERRHAAGAGRRDRLPVVVVGHVAGGVPRRWCRRGISFHELAAKRQLSAERISYLSDESPATLALYGVEYTQNLLKARFLANASSPDSWSRREGGSCRS